MGPSGASVHRQSIKKQMSPSELQPGVQYVSLISDHYSFQMHVVYSYLTDFSPVTMWDVQ